MKSANSLEPPERTVQHAIVIQQQLNIVRAKRIKKQGKFAQRTGSDGSDDELTPREIAEAFINQDLHASAREDIPEDEIPAIGESSVDDFMNSYDVSTPASYDEPEPGTEVADVGDVGDNRQYNLESMVEFAQHDAAGDPGDELPNEFGGPNIADDDDFLSSLGSVQAPDQADIQKPVHISAEKNDELKAVLAPDLQKLLGQIRGHII